MNPITSKSPEHSIARPAVSVISNGSDKNHPYGLLPSLLSMVGTGGAITPQNIPKWSRLTWMQNSPNPLVSLELSPTREIIAISPSEHVANIRDGFAMSMSDLAVILGVTRPTAYAWLKGDEPKPEKVRRIHQLSAIADRVKGMNISRLDKLVHRPLADGRSLFDVLKAEEDPTDLLASLQALAIKEAEIRQQPKGSGKNLRSLDDTLGDLSAPMDFDASGVR